MFNYSVQVLKDDEDNVIHCVFEHSTQQAVDFFYFYDDAKERMLFLESGGAFDGFTPSFVLRGVEIPKTAEEINNSFMEIINADLA